jgi:hypothetical protein
VQIKLVSANEATLFQERMQRFLEDLPPNALIVDVKFSSTAVNESLVYSALVHVQITEEW